MLCPKCQKENLEGAKFCAFCSVPLETSSVQQNMQPNVQPDVQSNIQPNVQPLTPMQDPAPVMPEGPMSSKSNLKVIVIIISGLILLCILVVIGYFLVVRDKDVSINSANEKFSIDSTEVLDTQVLSDDVNQNVIIPVEDNSKCDEEYNKIIAEYGKTYDDCYGEVKTASCDGREDSNKKKNLVLILDSSGSMAAKLGGESKMEISKKASMNFVKNMNEDVSLSIIVYGHKGSNNASDKAISCAGIDQVYWLGLVNPDIVNSKISPLQATGWTPIAGSLQKAKEILSSYPATEYSNSILLVSDGEETCGGNPAAKAKELNRSDINFKIDVIGFDVGGVAENQLKAVSKNGEGTYYSARSSKELDEAMYKVSEMACMTRKNVTNAMNGLSVNVSANDCGFKLSKEWNAAAQAINIGDEVTKECRSYVRTKYNARYQEIKAKIEGIWQEGNEKVEQNAITQDE